MIPSVGRGAGRSSRRPCEGIGLEPMPKCSYEALDPALGSQKHEHPLAAKLEPGFMIGVGEPPQRVER